MTRQEAYKILNISELQSRVSIEAAKLAIDTLFDNFEQQLKEKDDVIYEQSSMLEADTALLKERDARIAELEEELNGFKNSLEWNEYKDHCECKAKLKRYENPVAELWITYDSSDMNMYEQLSLYCDLDIKKDYTIIVLEGGE